MIHHAGAESLQENLVPQVSLSVNAHRFLDIAGKIGNEVTNDNHPWHARQRAQQRTTNTEQSPQKLDHHTTTLSEKL